MKNDFFLSIENNPDQSAVPLKPALDHLAFNEDGLIPVITQDSSTGKVLMMAWMNRQSIEKTLTTKRMTYWSRSRQDYWVKGETSGHTQQLVSMSLDCDGDAILCLVEQQGAACHTGREGCFYLAVNEDTQEVIIQGKGV